MDDGIYRRCLSSQIILILEISLVRAIGGRGVGKMLIFQEWTPPPDFRFYRVSRHQSRDSRLMLRSSGINTRNFQTRFCQHLRHQKNMITAAEESSSIVSIVGNNSRYVLQCKAPLRKSLKSKALPLVLLSCGAPESCGILQDSALFSMKECPDPSLPST